MSGINPEDSITPAEIEILDQLEAIVQPGLGTYVDVGDALSEIRDRHLYRDSHPSFEAYVRERWGVDVPNGNSPAQTCADAVRGARESLRRDSFRARP